MHWRDPLFCRGRAAGLHCPAHGVDAVTLIYLEEKSGPEKGFPLVGLLLVLQQPRNTVKLLGNPARQRYRLRLETSDEHLGETRGYGNNLLNRDNEQPSPTVPGLWVQFTD